MMNDQEVDLGGDCFAKWFETGVHGGADLCDLTIVGYLQPVFRTWKVGYLAPFYAIIAKACDGIQIIFHCCRYIRTQLVPKYQFQYKNPNDISPIDSGEGSGIGCRAGI